VRSSSEDSEIQDGLEKLEANRNRAYNQGLSVNQVDRSFMKPIKYYIKNVLQGDETAKIIPDSSFYANHQGVNDKLLKKEPDNFVSHQLQQRITELRQENSIQLDHKKQLHK
jgi:hypothetical protein